MTIFNSHQDRLRAPTVCKTARSPLVSDDEYLTFTIHTNVAPTNLNPSGSATWNIAYANPNLPSGTPVTFQITPPAAQSANQVNNDFNINANSTYLDPKTARWISVTFAGSTLGVYFLEPKQLTP